MLNIIYGRAASGKTYTVYEAIKNDVKNNQKAVLLVPEQFTFESERNILNLLGDKNSSLVEVISFSSLADRLSETLGGSSKKLLSDAQKIVFMKKTLSLLSSELNVWKNYIRSTRFASKIVDIIGEFKINSVSPEDLSEAVEKLADGTLKAKMQAVLLAYRTYDSLLANHLIDPADKLTLLYDNLKKENWFKGKNVYIDSFNGFTGQQYKIIDQILSTALNTTVTGLCDTIDEDKLNIFNNTRATLFKIIDLAKKRHIGVNVLKLENSRYENQEMRLVESMLAGYGHSVYEETTDNIAFCEASSVNDEACFTARTIRKLVRNNGYRYNDFVVIARNAQIFETAIEREFKANDISVFFDKRTPLTASPVYRVIDSAICAVRSFSSNDIFRYLKTQIVGGISTEEISTLENYAYIWNIKGDAWFKEWTMNPSGFNIQNDDDEETVNALNEDLKKLNELCVKVIKPLETFKNSFCGNVKGMATAIVQLLKNIDASNSMKAFLNELPYDISAEDADALRQSWDKINDVLDGIVSCFGGDYCDTEEFYDMFKTACDMTTVGRVPQMLDQVTFGEAERIRPFRPKVVFVLGANQGVFPAFPENNSILGNNDRSELVKVGLDIKNKTVYQSVEENLLVYSCACCATDKLYISYSVSSSDGKSRSASSFYNELKNVFKNAHCYKEPSDALNTESLPETTLSAYNMLCNLYGQADSGKETLKSALQTTDFAKQYKINELASGGVVTGISTDTARKLYGKNVYISPTKFDKFYTCRFSYFCRYGLSTGVIKPADLNVLQRGTMIHYVLEKFCSHYLDEIALVTDEQIISDTNYYLDEYLSLIKGSETLMTPRFCFLLNKIKEGIIDVLRRIVSEFAQSKFLPNRCEVSIGKDGTIPTVQFGFDSGVLNLTGSIDRLDTYGSYVRIVDYKTGTKQFKISDTLYGQNMQMLIYLYCVVRGGNTDYNGRIPAGILYLISQKDLKKKGIAMNGIIAEDISIVKAMEEKNEGKFVPKLNENKPSSSFLPTEYFNIVFDHIESLAKNMGKSLHSGKNDIDPIDASITNADACKYCDYKSVCGIEDKKHKKISSRGNLEVIALMQEGDYEI